MGEKGISQLKANPFNPPKLHKNIAKDILKGSLGDLIDAGLLYLEEDSVVPTVPQDVIDFFDSRFDCPFSLYELYSFIPFETSSGHVVERIVRQIIAQYQNKDIMYALVAEKVVYQKEDFKNKILFFSKETGIGVWVPF